MSRPAATSLAAGKITVSHVLGEISWLVSQSPRHGSFPVAELAWFAMPAIAARQFHIFREGDRPIGVALWAFPTSEGEARLGRAPLSPVNRLAPEEWTGGGPLWLADLVAPFATRENRHIELMLGDLMTGPFKGRAFRMLRLDPATGAGSVAIVEADAGTRLVTEMAASMKERVAI